MDTLEARLGYEFRTPSLLVTALTLPSVANERKISGKAYQRLEFLGDGVVDLVISERLYHLFPDDDEGVLSKMWTRVVKTETMAQIARQLGLGADLSQNKPGRGSNYAGHHRLGKIALLHRSSQTRASDSSAVSQSRTASWVNSKPRTKNISITSRRLSL